AGLVADGIELTPVALELLALRLDDLRRSIRGEPLVGDPALGARDLLAKALDLGFGVAVGLDPLGPDDGVEDPLVVAVELGTDAAAAEDGGRRPGAGEGGQ